MLIEKWLDIVGYEDLYQISNFGRVKSLPKMRKYKLGSEYIMKPTLQVGKKYFRIGLSKDKKVKTLKIHLLVLTAFVSSRPIGMQGCHNDGDSANNFLDNLRWDTPKNNQNDRKIHGTSVVGEGNGRAILNEKDVLEIRASPLNNEEISLKYGLALSYINNLKKKRTWAHI